MKRSSAKAISSSRPGWSYTPPASLGGIGGGSIRFGRLYFGADDHGGPIWRVTGERQSRAARDR
jgi:hypothetical protein